MKHIAYLTVLVIVFFMNGQEISSNLIQKGKAYFTELNERNALASDAGLRHLIESHDEYQTLINTMDAMNTVEHNGVTWSEACQARNDYRAALRTKYNLDLNDIKRLAEEL